MKSVETIAAIATPSGTGGVGIIRVSGRRTKQIAEKFLGFVPKPRYATYCEFKRNNRTLDQGIAIYFSAPHSFTGEDVLELQGHGGPVVLDILLKNILEEGVRLAHPGEFSERAFLNNKIDLTQAEAIADLINASSESAYQSALRSLKGNFSRKINDLSNKIIELRKMVEAAIDFPEEEIDFLAEQDIQERLQTLIKTIQQTIDTAKQGALLREGMTVVIAGRPNAGKSSLLNCLSGRESAIVTEIAGTTRDILREHIHIDGMPLHVIDTAGIRDTNDVVEKEGVRRALDAIKNADLILLMIDGSQHKNILEEVHFVQTSMNVANVPIVALENKVDLTNKKYEKAYTNSIPIIRISAKKNIGVDILKEHLKSTMGYKSNQEGVFTARRRHIDALMRTLILLEHGFNALDQHQAGELLAEDLRLAHKTLGEIVGEFSSDDLLGEIFSSFCIGK